MVVPFPSLRGDFFNLNRLEPQIPRVHNSAGNQTGSTRSECLIGSVPLPWNMPVRRLPLPVQRSYRHHQSMVFPLTSPTTFIPTQPSLRRDFYARMFCEIAGTQPIALAMAAGMLKGPSKNPCLGSSSQRKLGSSDSKFIETQGRWVPAFAGMTRGVSSSRLPQAIALRMAAISAR
jgi:hypothetical protein